MKTELSEQLEEYRKKLAGQSGQWIDKGASGNLTDVRPKVKCETCNDTGLVKIEGQQHLDVCPDCSNPLAMTRTGLRLSEKSLTWESLKPIPAVVTSRGKTVKTTADHVGRSIRDYIKTKPGAFVVLSGEYGQAKSLLLKIATAEALRQKRNAVYTSMAGVLDVLRDAYDQSDPRESALARLRYFESVPVLAVDEVDKINLTDWVAEKAFALIDRRYEASLYGGAVTLLASNLEPIKFSQALASRASDGRAFQLHFTGSDVRPVMTWEA